MLTSYNKDNEINFPTHIILKLLFILILKN
jgi:hypothetical protein